MWRVHSAGTSTEEPPKTKRGQSPSPQGRVPTVVALQQYSYIIAAANDIRAGDTLAYGPWALWNPRINKYVIPVFRVEE